MVETGSAREVHHFALLGGYGAEAVHPYLALETLLDLAAQGKFGAGVDGKKAIKNFVKAIGKGLKKVMSKMGISTYMSYTGAQIFEAVGLARTLVDKYFTGTRLVRSAASTCSKSPRDIPCATAVRRGRARVMRRARMTAAFTATA